MLKSLNQFPPSGWEFFQPQTGWRPNAWMDFNNVVQQIISHRQANPRFNLSVDREAVAAELSTYTEKRLRDTYGAGADQWLVIGSEGAPPGPFITPRRHRPGVAGAVEAARFGVKNAMAGIGTVMSWLGNGLHPTSQESANARAAVCARCEFNKPPNTLQAGYAVIAKELQELMEAKAQMELRTPDESLLQTCSLCDCHLPLKIWVPLDEIKNKTSPVLLSKLPGHCWVKIELQNDSSAQK